MAVAVHSPTRQGNWLLTRQLEISLVLILGVLLANVLIPPVYELSTRYTPAPSWHLVHRHSRFLFLSFKLADGNLHYKGRDDAYLISFWVLAFWFLREASMRWFWAPLARRCGVKEGKAVVRFSEQGWSLLYYSVFWSLGLCIMQSSPYSSFKTDCYWKGYPHDALAPLTKGYYLVQTSFWLQTLIVLNLEAKRKDYLQMLSHHIITFTLVSLSYVLNFTRVGNVILVIMDFSDILLPLAKLLIYTRNKTAADAVFGLFLVSWLVTRHLLFGVLLYSASFEPQRYLPYDLRPRDGYFFNQWIHGSFVVLLYALQMLICMWFWMIAKVAWNVVMGKGVDDSRSEGGDSDDDGDAADEGPEERAGEDRKDR